MKCNEYASILSDQNFLNAMNLNESSIDWNSITSLPDSATSNHTLPSSLNDKGDHHEDLDFSDLVLKYINQMLMEEDIEEKNCTLQKTAALHATEKSFYDALMKKEVPYDKYATSESITYINGRDLSCDVTDSPLLPNPLIDFDSQSRFHPSLSSTSNVVDSPVSILSFPDIVKVEIKHEINSIRDESRGKKNHHSKDHSDDERTSKQSAVYAEPTVRSKMFDEILLYGGGNKTHPFKSQPKEPKPVKSRGKKQGSKKEVVDLRTLLTLCAQSVSTNDQIGVTDLLKKIKQHASPTGDGMQRLAHYFSIGLEARMAGSGTGIYNSLISKPTSAIDILKAYHLFLGILPFTKLSHFVSNKTIIQTSQNKTKLHIIDFGIFYGFQWPSVIQSLSSRPGGPPELRITGIDFPCPGFRPSQRVEETGSRLSNYAETFGVKFKFKAIAQKWETITLQDLELDSEETLIVNCPYRLRNLLDETVMADNDSPRNKVLKLIKETNPEIFIQGIVNGSYNAPFFVTRFREALFFFSSLFDLLEANVGREVEERMLIERTIWGREAMNVIACEGGERIERPETYKQWQVRNQRMGFRQVAFDRKILEVAKEKTRLLGYHKDFVIDEDGGWMLQGWKGRILYAISCWKPC
ncbi:unnamed protein product [Lactuca virosa]|uniref:Uncharacterized protein n=1 Tax=Lactuca virosa TaxID=75947 RepID=A0AAU9MVS8_9ASTR|nr:unnamed protein product [Lactuca virosa]